MLLARSQRAIEHDSSDDGNEDAPRAKNHRGSMSRIGSKKDVASVFAYLESAQYNATKPEG